MTDRTQKVEELLADLRSLRRAMAIEGAGSATMPRVTPSQWGVLMLVEQQEMAVKDVSHALGITSSAATQLVDGLVKSGYLVRKPSAQDRRIVTLALSKKSKSHVERMKKQALQKFLAVFKTLSDEEFDHYVALNKKLIQASLAKKTI